MQLLFLDGLSFSYELIGSICSRYIMLLLNYRSTFIIIIFLSNENIKIFILIYGDPKVRRHMCILIVCLCTINIITNNPNWNKRKKKANMHVVVVFFYFHITNNTPINQQPKSKWNIIDKLIVSSDVGLFPIFLVPGRFTGSGNGSQRHGNGE